MDERREMTEVESGSIMSAGRLTSDILERPVSNETRCMWLHTHTDIKGHQRTK